MMAPIYPPIRSLVAIIFALHGVTWSLEQTSTSTTVTTTVVLSTVSTSSLVPSSSVTTILITQETKSTSSQASGQLTQSTLPPNENTSTTSPLISASEPGKAMSNGAAELSTQPSVKSPVSEAMNDTSAAVNVAMVVAQDSGNAENPGIVSSTVSIDPLSTASTSPVVLSSTSMSTNSSSTIDPSKPTSADYLPKALPSGTTQRSTTNPPLASPITDTQTTTYKSGIGDEIKITGSPTESVTHMPHPTTGSKAERPKGVVKPSVMTVRPVGMTTESTMPQTTRYPSGSSVSSAAIRSTILPKQPQHPFQLTTYRTVQRQWPKNITDLRRITRPIMPSTDSLPVVRETTKVLPTMKPEEEGHMTTVFKAKVTTAIPFEPRSSKMTKSTTQQTLGPISKHGTTSPSQATDPGAQFIPTTVSTELPKNVKYIFRFKGNCSILVNDTDAREIFENRLRRMLTNSLGVPYDNILLYDISCGSVDVELTLHDIQQTKVEKKLAKFFDNAVPLSVTLGSQTHAFLPIGYNIIGSSSNNDPVPTPPDVKQVRPTNESHNLRSVDMIIIIVVSIIGGVLIIIIITLIIHECRRRSHTKSFDLRGTPQPHINTEDFTLTKMERGPAEYNEYGFVVNSISNGHSRTPPQVGIATIVETPRHQNGEATFSRYHQADQDGYEPDFDGVPDSPSVSLMKSVRIPQSVGIENPSFSSEDILDSGTETDRDNVCSDKAIDSPDHIALSLEQVECDSGRQSDSPMELCSSDTLPEQSPRSTLGDNTDSDNMCEDIPSEEVLMSTEELSYPLDESPEVIAEGVSTRSPPIGLCATPDPDAYEMVETKRGPGSRESGMFVVTEGATAF